MTDEMIALGRRAVACKGWRWMPGMRVEWVGMGTGWRMLSKTQSWYEREECKDGEPGGPNAIPDLTDPATLGCLLALVREAWGCVVVLSPDYDDDEEGAQGPLVGWRAVETVRWISVSQGATEPEALVAALEAVP